MKQTMGGKTLLCPHQIDIVSNLEAILPKCWLPVPGSSLNGQKWLLERVPIRSKIVEGAMTQLSRLVNAGWIQLSHLLEAKAQSL